MSLRPAVLLLASCWGALQAQSVPARDDSVRGKPTELAVLTGDDVSTIPVAKFARAGAKAGDKPWARLSGILIGRDDLPPAMRITTEGVGIDTSGPVGFLLAMASTTPTEEYERAFQAEQMVASVGDSRVIAVAVAGATFRTRAEANRPLEGLDLLDLPVLWRTFIGQEPEVQMTLDTTRAVSLDGVGDRASGWLLEITTPVAQFEMAFLFVARGRLATLMTVAGPRGGLQDRDLAGLLRTMDERALAQDGYVADLEPESIRAVDASAADSALAAITDVPLNTIPFYPADSTALALTTGTATVTLDNGWPSYTLMVEGRGLTFPFGGVRAIDVTMTVTLHDTEAEALKEVLAAESGHLSPDDTSGFGALFAEAGSTRIETVLVPGLGARAVRGHMTVRGMMRLDVDMVVFARGRLSAAVMVSRLPGSRDSAAVDSVAREMDRRIQDLLHDARTVAAPQALVDAVRRVVDAEIAVDSLVGARDFDAAFRVIERTQASHPPVGFSASTMGTVCWWASLHGHAPRALPACESAVAPDTTVVVHRESRGLARALTGDLAGAADDFAFVVEQGDWGESIDERSGWLDALRAGRNPFTEKVLAELRGTSH